MHTALKALAILGYTLLALSAAKADTTVTITTGPKGLVCQAPVNGVSQCSLNGRALQCVVSADGKVTSCF